MDRLVAAGKVGGLFGVKGEVTLALYDIFPREPNMEEPVFVKIDSHTVPLFFQSFRRRGQRGATAVFEDIDTEARAAELVGLEFSIAQGGRGSRGETGTQGFEEAGDELYFEDLVGWDAELDTGQRGRITDFLDSELNPLFEVEIWTSTLSDTGTGADTGAGSLSGERVLIPVVDDFIVEADERRRTIVFNLPEGLLGLNK